MQDRCWMYAEFYQLQRWRQPVTKQTQASTTAAAAGGALSVLVSLSSVLTHETGSNSKPDMPDLFFLSREKFGQALPHGPWTKNNWKEIKPLLRAKQKLDLHGWHWGFQSFCHKLLWQLASIVQFITCLTCKIGLCNPFGELRSMQDLRSCQGFVTVIIRRSRRRRIRRGEGEA